MKSSSCFLGIFLGAIALGSAPGCSSAGNRGFPIATDAGVDAAIDAGPTDSPPTDHGLALSSCDPTRATQDADHLVHRTLSTAGADRSFEFLRPNAVKCEVKSSLLVLLHPKLDPTTVGSTTPGSQFASLQDSGSQTSFVDFAKTNNFLLAAANGLIRGDSYDWAADTKDGVADSVYIHDLIDALLVREEVNAKRVYVLGFGEGGSLALRSACDSAFRVTAAGSVAGSMTKGVSAACAPAVPVSIFFAASNQDSVMPYDGDATYLSYDETTAFWVNALRCDKSDTRTTNISGGSATTYPTCAASSLFRSIQASGTHANMASFLRPSPWDFFKSISKSY